MWIVRLALRRPYTFVVAAILILILGVVSILRTPTDIFPNINIPVISVLWTYNGLSPEEVSGRIVYQYERTLTTTVNDIEHIESQCWNGRAIVKIFLQPGATSGPRSRRSLRFRMPPSAACPPELRRRWSCSTTHLLCPSCSWDFPVRV